MSLEAMNTILIISNVFILISNIIITLGFLLAYFKNGPYIHTIVKYESNIDTKELGVKYPIKEHIILTEDVNEFFLIRTPGNEIENIKILKWNGKSSKYLFSSKHKFKYKTDRELENKILSEEYLLIQTHVPEGIPEHKIKARINGEIMELDFAYNGLYGTRDKEYIKVNRDLKSLFYYIFLNK